MKGSAFFLLTVGIYCGDTIFMCEFFNRMKTWRGTSSRELGEHLGEYLPVAIGLLRFGRSIRNAILEWGSMLSFFELCRGVPHDRRRLAARGLWVPHGQDEGPLRCTNFTSFSLSLEGAAVILDLYEGDDLACVVPLVLLVPQKLLLEQGLVTHPFYPETESEPGSGDEEQEVVLPPFAQFYTVEGCTALSLQDLSSADVTRRAAAAWSVAESVAYEHLRHVVACAEKLRSIGNRGCSRGHRPVYPELGVPCCGDAPEQRSLHCAACGIMSCLQCDEQRWAASREKSFVDPKVWLKFARFTLISQIVSSWGDGRDWGTALAPTCGKG
mmetsp:Transcript_33540/g.106686  ORF Transcript_33540/g.106686 Transcript_33540/m.106686 type:complete len:327 (-) Transcript_33540:68-1048(-)